MTNQANRIKRPRGIIFLALLLLLGGLVAALAGLVPALRERGVPAGIYFVGALYFCVLAWGLVQLRRWAWYVTLICMAISVPFVLQSAALSGGQTLAPIGFLAIGAIYLLQPGVRGRFLRGAGQDEPS